MQCNHEHITTVIKSIRDSHPDIVKLYTQGQCYNFYKILKAIYGDNISGFYSTIEGHVYCYFDNQWYDIRGQHSVVPDDLLAIEYYEEGGDPPVNWGKRDRRRLTDDTGEDITDMIEAITHTTECLKD